MRQGDAVEDEFRVGRHMVGTKGQQDLSLGSLGPNESVGLPAWTGVRDEVGTSVEIDPSTPAYAAQAADSAWRTAVWLSLTGAA
jgi:hypothetical protein